MEVRYLGFDQQDDQRAYHFDVHDEGGLRRQLDVTADIALFQVNRVPIQEGPSLCARKLAADLAIHAEGTHILTNQDLRLHAEARAAVEARKSEMRQNAARRPRAQSLRESPWRRGPA